MMQLNYDRVRDAERIVPYAIEIDVVLLKIERHRWCDNEKSVAYPFSKGSVQASYCFFVNSDTLLPHVIKHEYACALKEAIQFYACDRGGFVAALKELHGEESPGFPRQLAKF